MKKSGWSRMVLAVAFILLILIGAYALAEKNKAGINQTQTNIDNNKLQTEKSQPTKEDSSVIDKRVQAADAMQKQLEDKYEEGYKAFFKDQYTTAINLENEVIEQDPDFYKAYNLKGIALCYSGDFKNGMANIDKSLSMKPDFGYALFNKGLAYELFGYYDKALLWYNKDLQIENYVWSYYGISSIYGRWGDVSNTIKYLKIAIKLEPGIKEMAKTEKDFNNVRNYEEFQALINN